MVENRSNIGRGHCVAANSVRAVALRNSVYHYGNPAAMKKQEFENKFTQADNSQQNGR